MCAPMSIASSVPLALACCNAGIIGGWQGGTFTSFEEFERYLVALYEAKRRANDEGAAFGPPIVNFPARIATEVSGDDKLALCERYKPPLVLSSIGDPAELIKRAHGWGARVIHDVVSVKHAEKAIAAGADGLMLTCAGAGGTHRFPDAVCLRAEGPLHVRRANRRGRRYRQRRRCGRCAGTGR